MIIDESNVNKEERNFGIGNVIEVPFIIYREPDDDDIYMYYNGAFMIDDGEMIEIVKEGMTFQEAFDEVLQLRKDYVESTENEGDQYHTINLNLETGETEKEFHSDYYGTLLLNKNNYGINVQSLSDEDCNELMKVRGKIADMASDWYGGAVGGDVVLKDIMSIFELNNIQVDISEYQKAKEVDIMLFDILSYIDSVIIAIQRKMLTRPIVGVDLANTEENENVEEKE
jgi:hypothetical protein